MKQPNKHLVRAVATLTTASILVPSCNFSLENGYIIPGIHDKGASAIALSLSKDELDYLNFINKLGSDIVKHPVIAQQFAKNPQLFLEKYGYKEPIDLDEDFLRLVLALGDDEINTAIRAGDIKTVLAIMNKKNLLSSNYYSKIQIDEEQKKEILALMGFNDDSINNVYACGIAVCLAIVIVAAYMYLGVVAAGYAAIVASVYLGVRTNTETWIYNPNNSIIIENNPSLKIWGLKGNAKDAYVAVDMLIEKEADNVIELMRIYKGEEIKNIDMSRFREFIKLNLSQISK